MKKLNLLSVLLILTLLLALTSCDVFMGTDGRDGKAYLKVTIDSSAEAWYGYMEGFPDNWDLDTYYELDAGEHEAKYALCKSLGFDGSYYNWAVNSYHLTNSAVYSTNSSMTSLDALIFYLEENGVVFSNTFTFEVEKGTSGSFPFKDGINGQDTDYSLYLAWDPTYSVLSSNDVPLEKTVLTDKDNKTIIQFTDNYGTFTFSFPEKTNIFNIENNPVIRAIQ